MTTVSRPARGTRPANRHAGIVAAATELFRSRGYEHVSMGDIGEAVAVGPSALYRHFPGKQQLLYEVVRTGLTPIAGAVEQLDLRDQPHALTRLAQLALDNTYLGTLWAREARHLPLGQQEEVNNQIHSIATQLAEKCKDVKPDVSHTGRELLAWSLLGILLSPSFHNLQIPRQEHAALLVDMMRRILDAPIPPQFGTRPATPPAEGLMPFSRREALLVQATKLFAQRRYASVGIEDVAAALGLAGPSVYSHFASKSDLLAVALGRGAEYLYLQVAEVLSSANTAAEGLHGLIRSYTGFSVAHPDLVAILVSEVRNLTESYRDVAIQAQRDYVNEWTHLLQEVSTPRMKPAVARLHVQAALTVINTVTQVRQLRTGSDAVSAITAVIADLLGVSSVNGS